MYLRGLGRERTTFTRDREASLQMTCSQRFRVVPALDVAGTDNQRAWGTGLSSPGADEEEGWWELLGWACVRRATGLAVWPSR